MLLAIGGGPLLLQIISGVFIGIVIPAIFFSPPEDRRSRFNFFIRIFVLVFGLNAVLDFELRYETDWILKIATPNGIPFGDVNNSQLAVYCACASLVITSVFIIRSELRRCKRQCPCDKYHLLPTIWQIFSSPNYEEKFRIRLNDDLAAQHMTSVENGSSITDQINQPSLRALAESQENGHALSSNISDVKTTTSDISQLEYSPTSIDKTDDSDQINIERNGSVTTNHNFDDFRDMTTSSDEKLIDGTLSEGLAKFSSNGSEGESDELTCDKASYVEPNGVFDDVTIDRHTIAKDVFSRINITQPENPASHQFGDTTNSSISSAGTNQDNSRILALHSLRLARAYRLRYEELIRDIEFQKKINLSIDTIASTLINENPDHWNKVTRQTLLISACSSLIDIFPRDTARFSLRVLHNNRMVVWATSHPNQVSSPIDLSLTNTIKYSLDIGCKPVLYMEHFVFHQETARTGKTRDWTNYVCQCILVHPDNPETPLLSLCFDVIGDEADYILRFLNTTGYFDRLTNVIRLAFTHFGRLLDMSSTDIITIYLKPIVNEMANKDGRDN